MKRVSITVNVDGNEIRRKYIYKDILDAIEQEWDSRIVSMLDTLSKSDVKEF